MFEIFSRKPFPWNKVHLFWVDERIVPPTDPENAVALEPLVAKGWLAQPALPEGGFDALKVD